MAETNRRNAITPEQRAEEDRQAAEKEKASEREVEVQRLKISAERTCKDYVRQFLRWPDDASFPWFGCEISANREGTVFGCQGTVKAKNDFGGELTHRWGAIVYLDDDVWRLVTMVIDGQTIVDDKQLADRIAAKRNESRSPPPSPPLPEPPDNAPQVNAPERPKASRPTPTTKLPEPQRRISTDAGPFGESANPFSGEPAPKAKTPKTVKVARPTPPKPPEPEWRTWTDASGTHTTEAQYKGVAFGQVKLLKRDGETITIPLEKLGDKDHEWISRRHH
jgi:hypothetical protein